MHISHPNKTCLMIHYSQVENLHTITPPSSVHTCIITNLVSVGTPVFSPDTVVPLRVQHRSSLPPSDLYRFCFNWRTPLLLRRQHLIWTRYSLVSLSLYCLILFHLFFSISEVQVCYSCFLPSFLAVALHVEPCHYRPWDLPLLSPLVIQHRRQYGYCHSSQTPH